MDLYGELGLKPDATPSEIKAAGRKAQKRTHPDAGGNAESFGRVQTALRVLLDPERREKYDRTGDTDTRDQGSVEAAMAMSALADAINQALSAGDPAHVDLVKAVRQHITQQVDAITNTEAAREKQWGGNIAKLETALKRLKRSKKKAGEDRIRAILDAQLDDIRRQLARAKSEADMKVRVLKLSLEMAEGYTYDVEPAPPRAPFANAAMDEVLKRLEESIYRDQQMYRRGL